MTVALRHGDDISEYFGYELSSVPSTLFDTSGFPRQPQKATLTEAIWSLGDCLGEEPGDQQVQYVLDGGSLVHRIPWSQGTTFVGICESYAEYVSRHFKHAVIVFDGYMSGPTIKDVAHLRRTHGVTGTNVIFNDSTPFRGKKDKFLSNPDNKQRFIHMLGSHLTNDGCTVVYADADADTLIAQTTISCAEKCVTVLIGEDTDLLVLLCFHVKRNSFTVLFKSGSKRLNSKALKVWDIQKTQKVIGETACKILPFVHAFTGCDSTSKIYGIGKGSAFKRIIADQSIVAHASVFLAQRSTREDVATAGEKVLVCLFSGHEIEGLNLLRFRLFARKVTIGVTCVQLQSLPPTAAAAKYHYHRAYYQVQCWTGNTELIPTEWGWHLQDNMLFPVKTDVPPAPESLIKVIKCNCKINCDTRRCTCRKHGLDCSVWCGECKGIQCTNAPVLVASDVAVDE